MQHFLPTADYLTYPEDCRFTTLYRTIEYGSVKKFARIMAFYLIFSRRFCLCTFGELETTLKDLYLAAPLELKENWERLGEAALSDLQQLFESARSELCILSKEELASCYERIEEKTGLLRRLKRKIAATSDVNLLSYVERVKSEMRWLKDIGRLLSIETRQF